MTNQFLERIKDEHNTPTELQDNHIEIIKKIKKKYHILSLLELPCGISSWMPDNNLELENYTRADFVPQLVDWLKLKAAQELSNKELSNKQRHIELIDIRYDSLKKYDLICVNDIFTRLNYEELTSALYQIKQSGTKYLLTKNFDITQNRGMKLMTGKIFPIKLQIQPYMFPTPLEVFSSQPKDKMHWALWEIKDIPDFLATPQLRILFKNESAMVFDSSLNFNETEYLFSMKDYDCHIKNKQQQPLIIDTSAMNISSVYQKIMHRFNSIYGFDIADSKTSIYYYDTKKESIKFKSSHCCLIIPLILEKSTVLIKLNSILENKPHNEQNSYLLKMGSSLKSTCSQISFELQCNDNTIEDDMSEKKKVKKVEWALMIIMLEK